MSRLYRRSALGTAAYGRTRSAAAQRASSRAPSLEHGGDLTHPEYWAWVREHDARYRPSTVTVDYEGRKVTLRTPLQVWGGAALILEGDGDLRATQSELDRHLRAERVMTSPIDPSRALIRLIALTYSGSTVGPVRSMHSAIVLEPRPVNQADTIMYWRYYSDSYANYIFKNQIWGVTNTYLPTGGLETLFNHPQQKLARVEVVSPQVEHYDPIGFETSTPRHQHAGHFATGLEMGWRPGVRLHCEPYPMTEMAFVSKANINQNTRYGHHGGWALAGPEEAFVYDERRGDFCRPRGAFATELAGVDFRPRRWTYFASQDGSVYIYKRFTRAPSV